MISFYLPNSRRHETNRDMLQRITQWGRIENIDFIRGLVGNYYCMLRSAAVKNAKDIENTLYPAWKQKLAGRLPTEQEVADFSRQLERYWTIGMEREITHFWYTKGLTLHRIRNILNRNDLLRDPIIQKEINEYKHWSRINSLRSELFNNHQDNLMKGKRLDLLCYGL